MHDCPTSHFMPVPATSQRWTTEAHGQDVLRPVYSPANSAAGAKIIVIGPRMLSEWRLQRTRPVLCQLAKVQGIGTRGMWSFLLWLSCRGSRTLNPAWMDGTTASLSRRGISFGRLSALHAFFSSFHRLRLIERHFRSLCSFHKRGVDPGFRVKFRGLCPLEKKTRSADSSLLTSARIPDRLPETANGITHLFQRSLAHLRPL
jgi:hypothetical protein